MAVFGGLSSLGVGDIIAFVKLNGTETFIRDLDKLNGAIDKHGQMMNKAMNATLIAGAAAFTAATVAAAKFEQGMANVSTLVEGSKEEMDKLSGGLLDIARNVPDSIGSLQKGLYDLISSGATSANAIEALGLAAKAAAAGMTTTDTAIRAGMATINAYGLSMSELNRVYDIQFQAVNKGVLTYEQLSGAVGNVLPSAAALGVGLEDLYGAIASVTLAGIDANSATTYLARAFESMVENKDKWADFNIQIFDSYGKFSGLQPIIQGLSEKLYGLTDEAKQAELAHLGLEVRAARAILAMSNNYTAFDSVMGTVKNSAGAMMLAFDKNTDTFIAQAGILKNNLEASFISLGQNSLPVLKDLLTEINKHPIAITATIEAVGSFVIIMGTLALAIKGATAAQTLLTQANALFGVGMGPVALAITGAVAGITALVAIVNANREAEEKEITTLSDKLAKVKELEALYYQLITSTSLTEDQQTSLKIVTAELTTIYKQLGISLDDINMKMGNLHDETTLQKLAMLRDETSKMKDEMALLAQKTIDTSDATAGTVEKYGLLGAKLSSSTIASDLNAASMAALADKIKRNEEEMSQLAPTIDALQASIMTVTPQVDTLGNKANTTASAFKNMKAYTGFGVDGAGNEFVLLERHLKEETIPTFQAGVIPLIDSVTFKEKEMGIQTEDLSGKITGFAAEALQSAVTALRATDSAVGQVSAALINMAASGFNPVVVGTELLNAALDLFNTKSTYTPITLEQTNASLEKMGININKVSEELANFNNNISSPFINSLIAQKDALVAQLNVLQDAANWLSQMGSESELLGGAINDTTQKIRNLELEMLNLTAALKMSEDFENITASARYLSDEIVRQAEYFGVNALNAEAFRILLGEQVVQLLNTMAATDKSTQAYADLYAESLRVMYAISTLEGTTETYIATLSAADLEILKSAGYIKTVTDNTNQNTQAVIANAQAIDSLTGTPRTITIDDAQAISKINSLMTNFTNLNAVTNAKTYLINTSTSTALSNVTAFQTKVADALDTVNSLNKTVTTNVQAVVNISDADLRKLQQIWLSKLPRSTYTEEMYYQTYSAFTKWKTDFLSGAIHFHKGGMLTAHEGLSLGMVGGRKEVPFIGLEGEQVINPSVSSMYSKSQWNAFQDTGSPGALGGGSQPIVNIVVEEPGPLTNVRYVDSVVHKRIKETEKNYTVTGKYF